MRRVAVLTTAVTAVLAAGCTTLDADTAFAPVAASARERLDQTVVWNRSDDDERRITARVAELLRAPLDADAAVQVALLNSRSLQATFHGLGIAAAELIQTGRLPNPGFSFGRLRRGDEREIERTFTFDLARLLALPLLGHVEAGRFEQQRLEATQAMLALAAGARVAWIDAVAAEEAVGYARRVVDAAAASAELASRMAGVGNLNRLQRARELAFEADAALGLARAEQAQRAARERLTRVLGLWGEQTAFRLPARLPELPAAADDLPDLERTALASRLDVQAARAAVDRTAHNLGLARATRFVNVLEVGAVRDSSNREPTRRGWEVAFELPLFDWGTSRVAQAESIYRQAFEQAAATAIAARSEVREAYGTYRAAYDIARYQRDTVVPLRARIAEENLLRYNGMLVGVFELLADARGHTTAVAGYLEALRNFWRARADLDRAMTGRPLLADAGAGTTETTGNGTTLAAGASIAAGGHP
ncbi:MAG: TolC family protein [Lautropia sp.]